MNISENQTAFSYLVWKAHEKKPSSIQNVFKALVKSVSRTPSSMKSAVDVNYIFVVPVL